MITSMIDMIGAPCSHHLMVSRSWSRVLGANADDEIHVEGRLARLSTTDVLLDAPGRRSKPGGFRRALVHDAADGLTINFNGDYPGGVTINGKINGPDLDAAVVNLAVQVHQDAPALPRVASDSGNARWVQLALSEPVEGTA
jgi:hypothetical protein